MLVQDSAETQVVSSLLAAEGHELIELRGENAQFWSDFNGMLVPDSELQRLRAARATDRHSITIRAEDFADFANGDFRVRSGGPASYAGRFSSSLGPHGLLREQTQRAVDDVQIVSTTTSSANITFWTPGRVTGTLIEWGTSSQFGNALDRAGQGDGEKETFHTVSLVGLSAGTTHHFRVGLRDHEFPAEPRENEQAPVRWSQDMTFTTAAQEPEPRQLFVSLTGNDQNDGLSQGKAWRKLHHAAREARAGDVVTIGPGTYRELLRPLQTGTSEKRRITFRAEQPLTVFLDGGFERNVGDSGRSHAVQIMNKAYITLENLVLQNTRLYDNGGYRGGFGYAGLLQISGSAGLQIRACVMDGRARYMTGIVALDAGVIEGVPEHERAFVATDNVFLCNWMVGQIYCKRPCELRNNAMVRSLVQMIVSNGPDRSIVLRNNILHSLIPRKERNAFFARGQQFDSDYNCFVWDAENKLRIVSWVDRQSRNSASGIKGWREEFGQDVHGIEAEPGWGLSRITGGSSDNTPLRIEDVILPANSACRNAGEQGTDIGPRWERFLTGKPAASWGP